MMEDNSCKDYQRLAAAIIEQAVLDKNEAQKELKKNQDMRKRIENKIKEARNDGQSDLVTQLDEELQLLRSDTNRLKGEVLKATKFFNGDWFNELSEFVGIDPDYFREKLSQASGGNG